MNGVKCEICDDELPTPDDAFYWIAFGLYQCVTCIQRNRRDPWIYSCKMHVSSQRNVADCIALVHPQPDKMPFEVSHVSLYIETCVYCDETVREARRQILTRKAAGSPRTKRSVSTPVEPIVEPAGEKPLAAPVAKLLGKRQAKPPSTPKPKK